MTISWLYGGSDGKEFACNAETQVGSLGREDAVHGVAKSWDSAE